MGTQGTDMIAFRLPFCLGGVFLAFLLFLSVSSWGACRYVERMGYFIDYACYPTRPSTSYIADGVCVLSSVGTERYIGLACISNETSSVILSCEKACNGQNHGAPSAI